jgi:hypothetical protein
MSGVTHQFRNSKDDEKFILVLKCQFILNKAIVYFQDFYGKSYVQQKEDSFYKQTGLKFEAETSKMLHLEHGFLWC